MKKTFFAALPYLIALGSTLISILVCLLIFLWLGTPIVFIIFLPAIMLSTWYGGVKAGLAANIAASISIYYFFTIPYYSLDIKSISVVVQLIIFMIEGLIVSYFIDSERRYEKINLYKKQDKENKKIIEALKNELHSAKEEVALRDEFLAIASHELKTPLTTVVLQLQTTLHNIRNVSLSQFSVEHLLKMLQSMQNQANRLSRMINDLLNISLISTRKMTLELEDVDLATMIKDIADSFAEKLEKENLTLSVDIKNSILGKLDKLRLEQVLDNLISNALKYGNKKPIEICLEKQNHFAIIRVIDKGIGIKPSEEEKIFALFKRGTTEKDYKGLGIGLYIAQQIILLHGGRIEVKSSLGKGSIFSIFLPITS